MLSPESPSSLVWPPFIADQPAPLLSVLGSLKESQHWPTERLACGQQAQLMQLLEWADSNVPHYQNAPWPAKKLTELRHSPNDFWNIWRTVPTLTKAELRSQGSRMNAGELPCTHLPLKKTFTSGSTGISVEVGSTTITRMIWNALTLREISWRRRDRAARDGGVLPMIQKGLRRASDNFSRERTQLRGEYERLRKGHKSDGDLEAMTQCGLGLMEMGLGYLPFWVDGIERVLTYCGPE